MAPKNGIEMIDSDDDGDDDMSEVIFDENEKESEKKNKAESKPRVRQYPDTDKGPFVVCIRATDKPLQSTKITKFIRKQYKSDVLIRQINEFKIRVTFSEFKPAKESKKAAVSSDEARLEANSLPHCEIFNKIYRVYIPEKLVEVMGCITWACSESVSELVAAGQGKFKNDLFAPVEILDATRFEKVIDGSEERIKTSVVRVTFEGLVLPEQVCFYGLLIPVREFKRRQMFCKSCLNYNHTESHCNNKPKTTQTPTFTCIHCKTDAHKSGDKDCPRRKLLEKRDNERAKANQRKTYAEMLQILDPQSVMPGEANTESFPPLRLGLKRDRNRSRGNDAPSTSEENSPNRKRSRSQEVKSNTTPPGFIRQNSSQSADDEIASFIKSLFDDLELPPFINQLLLKYAVPFITQIFRKITTSFTSKVSQLASL